MFRTVPLSIIRGFSLYKQRWYMSYRFADSLRTGSGRKFRLDPARKHKFEKLVYLFVFIIRINSGSFKILDQDGTAVPSWSRSQTVSKPVWHIPLLCVQWKTDDDDGQRNCPKYVELYSKNKSEKLVHLVGFIIRIHWLSSPLYSRYIAFWDTIVLQKQTAPCRWLHCATGLSLPRKDRATVPVNC